ncbi:MAG: DUF134 domain-containing protein [Candidatus Delongbacteria bacterium]|nr:DUF134 domain-containing protein [Candidatus Delongbacteria bacterium]
MSRPKINRSVLKPPMFTEFKPVGVPSRILSQTFLSLDEYEAFRLADHLGFGHEEASEEMNISRSTFTRLIEQARKKVAGMLINGNILTIEGGNIHFRKNTIRCNSCGHTFIIDINANIVKCPECNSDSLQNFAGNFGHGRCCRGRNR